MHVSLTPELEARVKKKVASGMYNNASEVIREALRFMDIHEDWIYQMKLAHLKQEIDIGIKDMDAGNGLTLNSEQDLDAFFTGMVKSQVNDT